MRMKTAITPNHSDCCCMASKITPATPTKPISGRDGQAARTAQYEPQERLQYLAAIQGINRQHVKDEEHEIDTPDGEQQTV